MSYLDLALAMAVRQNFHSCYINKRVLSLSTRDVALPQNCCLSYAIFDIVNLSSKFEHFIVFQFEKRVW